VTAQVSDSNNSRAGRLPAEPYAKLRSLDRLVGTWEVTGSLVEGSVRFEWMDGGWFLVQHVELRHGDRAIRGVEYIGFDEDTRTLRSHFMDNCGSNFTYTWELAGDILRIWFGEQGSDNSFTGTFAEDGASYAGAWRWPGGGYEATMSRV
jgi:hypothetical protein